MFQPTFCDIFKLIQYEQKYLETGCSDVNKRKGGNSKANLTGQGKGTRKVKRNQDLVHFRYLTLAMEKHLLLLPDRVMKLSALNYIASSIL